MEEVTKLTAEAAHGLLELLENEAFKSAETEVVTLATEAKTAVENLLAHLEGKSVSGDTAAEPADGNVQ